MSGKTLTRDQADAIEAEMRRLESDPSTSLYYLRLFMQLPMPCGHATGNLLTCDRPPFGCVICGPPPEVYDCCRCRADLAIDSEGYGHCVNTACDLYDPVPPVMDTPPGTTSAGQTEQAPPPPSNPSDRGSP